ncbi:hypothetical protein Glove_71g11 [Diversispora epigaea]|uniref:Protein kinase domain-containing protein n=1 Tax=Diversispora epigaea TaxID=1348612 RepID=A0A397JB01_9GLOM|nr:hypothetical protein Glove_71g11 [Diversispora epigaea]
MTDNEYVMRFQDTKQIAKGVNESFLNEIAILLRTNIGTVSTTFFEITKDTETHEYMMILQYYKSGSLRNYLNNNFYNINRLIIHQLDKLYVGNVISSITVSSIKIIIFLSSPSPSSIKSFKYSSSIFEFCHSSNNQIWKLENV